MEKSMEDADHPCFYGLRADANGCMRLLQYVSFTYCIAEPNQVAADMYVMMEVS